MKLNKSEFAIEPGLELDGMVAKKIMNWKNIPISKEEFNFEQLETQTKLDWAPFIITGLWYDDKDKFTFQLPDKYSTDIKYALELVETMKKKNYDFCLETNFNKNLYTGYFFKRNNNFSTFYTVSAKTLPQTICLAALKAI